MNAVSMSRASSASAANTEPMLSDCVSCSVRRYLTDLDDAECPEGLYEMMLREVERPLLLEVMKWHDGNQSRAAATLGINRATLRKKLLHHGLS